MQFSENCVKKLQTYNTMLKEEPVGEPVNKPAADAMKAAVMSMQQDWERSGAIWRVAKTILGKVTMLNIFNAQHEVEWERQVQSVLDPSLKVNAYVLKTESMADTFTYPGIPVLSKANVLKGMTVMSFVTPMATPIFGMLVLAENLINTFGTMGNAPVPRITSEKKLIIPELEQVTYYHSMKMFEKFTPEENLAVAIHEIGHNANLWFNLITTLKASIIGTLLTTAGVFLANPQTVDNPAVSIGIIVVATIVALFIQLYILRKMEWRADSYAIQAGYGNELKSAFEKLNEFYRKGGWHSESGILKVYHGMASILFKFINTLARLGLSTHPDIDSRIGYAKGAAAGELAPRSQDLINSIDAIVDKFEPALLSIERNLNTLM